jgi:hypothetical protein
LHIAIFLVSSTGYAFCRWRNKIGDY